MTSYVTRAQFDNARRLLELVNDPNWKPAVHFVGFEDDRYHAACKVWGKPNFIHRTWDFRATQEIVPGDVAIFATGTDADTPDPRSFNDSAVL